MPMQFLNIELSDVSQIGVRVDSLFFPVSEHTDTRGRPIMIRGQCYALEYIELYNDAEKCGKSWHMLLLESSLAALCYEKPTKPTLIGYLPGRIMLLFVLTKQRRFLRRVYEHVRALPGYYETGQDAAPLALFRPIAYWSPPASMVALWPPDFYGASPAVESVVDTGSLAGYFSYPESDHGHTLSVELAGPDYVRVPTLECGQLAIGDRVYEYTNNCYQLFVYGRLATEFRD
ncbi:MAG: hypothetical protein ACOX5Q_09160 [Bacillota bacterium]